MRRSPPDGEQGMILVNVLLFVAIAAAVVMLMISAEEASLHRSSRLVEAGRARAAALGGEASAITALRRDAIAAPDTDNATEGWARLAAHDAPIRGGRFDLIVADASDRLNINLLARSDPGTAQIAARIADALELPPDLIARATEYLRLAGPVSDLGVLHAAELPAPAATRLLALVTALPAGDKINLNAAGEDMLTMLTGDPVTARGLIELRRRKGLLTPDDIAATHVSLPPIASYTSNIYWLRTRVRFGDTAQELTSLLLRRREGDRVTVVPIGRWWGASTAPAQAPTLP